MKNLRHEKIIEIIKRHEVETQEELKFIDDMSCDIVQGYFFDKPLEKEEFEKRLCAKYYGHGKQERAVCQE